VGAGGIRKVDTIYIYWRRQFAMLFLRGRQSLFELLCFGVCLACFSPVQNRIYCFNAIFCRCRAQKLAICLEISALPLLACKMKINFILPLPSLQRKWIEAPR